MKELNEHIDRIRQLCASNNVRNLYVFGSVSRNESRPDSDIDLLVDIADRDPIAYSEHYFSLKFQLEELLRRPVDLLEFRALRNPYLKERIEESKVLIYGE